jgi:hypothetical protein
MYRAVFERGRDYRGEGRIQHIGRFGDVVTAGVSGSQLYDVTVELDGAESTTQCTCPYEGPGDCKHTIAVLLEVAVNPPMDESERIEPVLETVSDDDLRAKALLSSYDVHVPASIVGNRRERCCHSQLNRAPSGDRHRRQASIRSNVLPARGSSRRTASRSSAPCTMRGEPVSSDSRDRSAGYPLVRQR